MVDVTKFFGDGGIKPANKGKFEHPTQTWMECKNEMRANGLRVEHINTNGEIHRVGTDKKPNGLDGWYTAHDLGDGYLICNYGDWHGSKNFVWRSGGSTEVTPQVFDEINRRMKEADKTHSVAMGRIARQRLIEAQQRYHEVGEGNVETHPYIKKKGIPSLPGLKVDMGKLMVPITRLDGQMVGLQHIDINGAKKFTKSSEPKAGFFFIGTDHQSVSENMEQRIILAEGVASGASIYEAVGIPVIVMWSAHFALSAAKALRGVTEAEIILCLDGDNVGRQRAEQVAAEVENCTVRVPSYKDLDYNDIQQQYGSAAIRRDILGERFGLRGVTARQFDTQPPEREWLVENFIEASKAGIMAGVGGIGKSMEALNLAMMIAQGKGDWMGHEIVRSGNVVYISAEDDLTEIHRRIDAIDPTKERLNALHDVYFLSVPDRGNPVTLLKEGEDGLAITSDADELVKELQTIEDLAMVIIDPIQAFVTAPISSSNEAAQLWASWAAGIAANLGCGVMSIHHMSKVALTGAQNSTEARAAIRGATALVDGHRFAIALWNASEAEVNDTCTMYGLHPADSTRVAKFAMVKANAGEIDRREKVLFRKGALFEPVLRVVGGTDEDEGGIWDDAN